MTEIAVMHQQPMQLNPELRITLMIGKTRVDIGTFWARWFKYEVWKCLKCVRFQFLWKKGLAEGVCGWRPCEFKERWDI